ncbi:lipid A biosynthesis acyltransferase [Ottowia beijingensis]|uniref:LpxL/LpxP family acyltransferase n=1 Tax=Ottowia beijingensis TaxID=1207057 RepID=UPI0036268146
MTHHGILFMRALAPLPLGVVRALGNALGRLLFVAARPRRRIALTNLRLCFPHWTEAERVALARRNFVYFTQAFLDRSWLWHGDPAVVRQRLRITGAVDDLTREGAVVMFAPHFYGMDAGGSAVMQQIDRPACTIYSTQPNAALDEWMQRGRQRFGDATLLSRTEGVKPIVRALREGKMLYLLPDMDLGPHESVFVPFYGVPTATVPSLSRFARLGHARVVPVITRLTDFGYEVKVHPAWPDYPTADATADAALMNRHLQDYIDEMPEQYYWVHKRFKTRPPGEPSLY